jgi:glycosyltransferase involved in cell wall biosynthesis
VRIRMFMPGLAPDALGARVHRDFAAAVNALGHEFRILTTESQSASIDARTADAEVLALSSAWVRADALAAPWLRTRTVLSSAAALARHLRQHGDAVDLLHVEVAYPFGAAAMLGVAASGWKGPVAITPMGEDTLIVADADYGFRRYALPRWLIGRTLRGAAALRCISPLHEQEIARLAPMTPRRVIPLNVSASVVAASQESAETRAARRRSARNAVDAAYGTAGRPLVLCLGRLHPFKGIDVLIAALRRYPEATVLIAGPSLKIRSTGDEASRLGRLVEQWSLGDRTRFLGPVTPDAALQLLASADVVAVPSRLESLNKVCVEAAAVGTPFVVTETTGIAAWASDGLGVVVPPSDQAALAEGLQTVVARARPLDPDRIRMFVEQFSPQVAAAAVVAFYRDVTGLT